MKMLITGATGFIGYHVAKYFLTAGDEVHLIVRPTSPKSKLLELPGKPNIHIHHGSTEELDKIFQVAVPDLVLHIAARAQYDHQLTDIEPLVSSNLLFGTQLLECAVRNATPHFINTGTFWQYQNSHHYNPTSLYAATKQAFQDILVYYIRACNLRVITLILFDTYGPDDPREKLFHFLRQSASSGKTLSMSEGEQLMDLVFIDDVVRAYDQASKLIQEPGFRLNGEAFSVCTHRRIRLRDVVRMYCETTGRTLQIKWGGRPYRPREVMVPWEGKTLPGWKAEVDLRSGIRIMEGVF
jgi:nucleoside-diphosphate-sugar epimerase